MDVHRGRRLPIRMLSNYEEACTEQMGGVSACHEPRRMSSHILAYFTQGADCRHVLVVALPR